MLFSDLPFDIISQIHGLSQSHLPLVCRDFWQLALEGHRAKINVLNSPDICRLLCARNALTELKLHLFNPAIWDSICDNLPHLTNLYLHCTADHLAIEDVRPDQRSHSAIQTLKTCGFSSEVLVSHCPNVRKLVIDYVPLRTDSFAAHTHPIDTTIDAHLPSDSECAHETLLHLLESGRLQPADFTLRYASFRIIPSDSLAIDWPSRLSPLTHCTMILLRVFVNGVLTTEFPSLLSEVDHPITLEHYTRINTLPDKEEARILNLNNLRELTLQYERTLAPSDRTLTEIASEFPLLEYLSLSGPLRLLPSCCFPNLTTLELHLGTWDVTDAVSLLEANPQISDLSISTIFELNTPFLAALSHLTGLTRLSLAIVTEKDTQWNSVSPLRSVTYLKLRFMEVWRSADLQSNLLRHFPNAQFEVKCSKFSTVLCLSGMPRLRQLNCGELIKSLEPVDINLPDVEVLRLTTSVELTGLSRCSKLRSLHLTMISPTAHETFSLRTILCACPSIRKIYLRSKRQPLGDLSDLCQIAPFLQKVGLTSMTPESDVRDLLQPLRTQCLRFIA